MIELCVLVIPATCMVVFVIMLCFKSVVLGGESNGRWRGGGGGSPFSSVYGFLGWFPCVGPLR